MSESLEQQVRTLIDRVRHLTPARIDRPALVYFDIIGIAWPIRCTLHLQQIAHDYVPVTIREWMYRDVAGQQVLKTAFTNGHIPLYVDPERTLNQSNRILLALGQQAGLVGDGPRELEAIESVLDQCYDALFHWNGIFPVNARMGIPDDATQARLDAFMGRGSWGLVSDGFHNNLRAFERYLAANPAASDFIVGDRLSVADLAAFNVLTNWYKAFDREAFTAAAPALDHYIQHIAEQPGIATYIRTIQEPTTWFRGMPTQVALRLTTPEELEGLVQLR